MATSPIGRIALLSIKPEFALPIINGNKKVEFRKQKFSNKVSHIVIYASSPLKKIIGYFEVSYVDEDSPDVLWNKYNTIGGISFDAFKEYYSSYERGVAIGVSKVRALREPLSLSIVDNSLSAPQSFTYLIAKAFDKVRSYI